MGGVAGAAGPQRLTGAPGEPHWLVGAGPLTVAHDRPTVWLASLADPAVRALADRVRLSAADRADLAHHHDAGERLLRRSLAKRLLASAGSCHDEHVTIARDSFGAPLVVEPAGWQLSVAARWPDGAVAVAREPVGVDLERITDEPVAEDLLTAIERARLAALPAAERPRAFAACWAIKEAHAKWSGRPRLLDPAAVETGATLVTSPLGTSRCWRRDHGVLVAALCVGA